MNINRFFKDNRWIPYALAGCVVVLFYLLASHFYYIFIALRYCLGFISPVLIGVIMAYILDPMVRILEEKPFQRYGDRPQLRRLLCVWITIIFVVLMLIIFMVALVPQIVKSLGTFFSNFDSYAQSLQNLINSFSASFAKNSYDISTITRILDNAIGKLADYIQDNLGNIVNKSINLGKTIFNVVISFILAIYMLCDKERLLFAWRRLLKALLPEKSYHEISYFWKRCNEILVRYMAGDLLDGLIVGVINFLFMSLAGMDYAALISVIVGLTNLAPTFGPLVGALVGSLFLVFVNPWYALWFLIFTIVLQTIDGYVIKPKLFGNTLGVSSLWILISIIVLGRILGIPGILIAIPFAAISDIIYKEFLLNKLESRKEEKKAAMINEEAQKLAEEAARKAAAEAIKTVVEKDSTAAKAMDDQEKEQK